MEFNLQHILLFPKSIPYIIACIKDPNFGEEIKNFIPKTIDFKHAVVGQPDQESLMVTADGQKWVSFVAAPEAYERKEGAN